VERKKIPLTPFFKGGIRKMNKENQFQFEWITDWETIFSDSFRLRWQSIYENAVDKHIFFHPTLCQVWIETYKAQRNLSPLFCIAHLGETTVFLPLVLWKKNWKNAYQQIIIPIGYSDFDYHDPLVIGSKKYSPDKFFQELTGELSQKFRFDKIELNGLRNPVNQWGWSKENDISPYCRLDGFKNQAEFLNSLKTALRGDLNRQKRRLSELATLTLYSYTPDKLAEAMEVLPRFLQLHRQRWPNAYKAPGFHKNLIKKGLAAGVVDFTELRVGDTVVSWHLGFSDKGRYYYYMPVIHPDYASYSPGKVHLLYLVGQSIEKGMTVFDHLRGDENYKTGWTNHTQTLYHFTLKSTKMSSSVRNWLAETGKYIIK